MKKGNRYKKQERLEGTINKDNVAPPKRFNASDKGQGHRIEEKKKDGGWKPIEC